MANIELKNGLSVHYRQAGSGSKILLCVHGNLASSIWWEPLFSRLPQDFTAYALDLPGSGDTPESGELHSMQYFVDLLDDFTSALALDSFYLVGHSMGGGISQLYTIDHPQKVLSLVLLDSIAADGFHVLFERGDAGMQALRSDRKLLAMAIRGIIPHCSDEKLIDRVIEAAAKASEQVFLEQPKTMHQADWFDRLPEIQCPVLFLHGEEDHFVPQEGSERTAAAIPNCTFEYVPNCGHSPNLEVPDFLAQKMFSFFSGA